MSAIPLRQPSVEALKAAPVYFRYGSNTKRVLVDGFTASAVLVVYDACNADNKAKIERMVSGSFAQFQRVISFAFKHITIK